MLTLIIWNLVINFCGQKIDLNTEIIECHQEIKPSEFKKLAKFKNIKILDLSNSNFSDLKYIESFKKIHILSLRNTEIIFKNVKNLVSLIELDIQRIKDLKSLFLLKKLKKIYIDKITSNIIKQLKHVDGNLLIVTKYKPDHEVLKSYNIIKISSYMYLLKNDNKINKLKYTLLKLNLNHKKDVEISIIDSLRKKNLIKSISNISLKNKLYKKLYLILAFYLIDSNININRIDSHGNSPLDYALGKYNTYFEDMKAITVPKKKFNKKLVEALLNHYALKGETIVEFRNNIYYFRDLFMKGYTFFKKTSLFTVIKLFKKIKNNGDK